MIGYLLALLAALSLAFTTVSDGAAVVFQGGPALGGWIGVLGGLLILLARRESIPYGPGIWPLLGLAFGRTFSALVHGAGWKFALVAWTGPMAYLAFAGSGIIAETLQAFGLLLAPLQMFMWLTDYWISSNLMAHLLMICMAAWLPWWRFGGGWIVAGLGIALATTTSKGAAVGAVVMLAWYWRRSWLALPLAPVAALGLYLARPWNTIQWRLECWSRTLRLVARSPLIGAGPGVAPWPEHRMGVHAHNLLLNSALWGGLIEMGAVVAGVVTVIRHRGRWPRWALAGLLGVGVHTLVDDFTGCTLCLALLAALLAAERSAP